MKSAGVKFIPIVRRKVKHPGVKVQTTELLVSSDANLT